MTQLITVDVMVDYRAVYISLCSIVAMQPHKMNRSQCEPIGKY